MHPMMLKEVIRRCQQRVAEGDHPTVPAFTVEQLEDAVVQLERELADAWKVPRVSRFATPQMVAVVRNANPWLTSSSVIHEWWTMMYDTAMKGASDE